MAPSSRLRKIVLIDDNETTNFLNERLIKRLGVAEEVQVFADASEGFRYLWGSTGCATSTAGAGPGPEPELVFVDLRMPGLDGVEFLELYRNLTPEARVRTKLAVLTTSMLPTDRARVAAYPDVEYLVKPLSREKLERLFAEHFPHVQLPVPAPTAG
ncbi:MAG: response regulator [Hymenobacteraceae bacterium]|nr:response regulator [Hymenobacteraceae bacterium]